MRISSKRDVEGRRIVAEIGQISAASIWHGGAGPAEERAHVQKCVICEREYEGPDMAHCPAYQGPICSLCCTLDARCGDLCKPHASLAAQWSGALRWLMPRRIWPYLDTGLSHFLLLMLVIVPLLATVFGLLYHQELNALVHTVADFEMLQAPQSALRSGFLKAYMALIVTAGIVAWWLVLAHKSRQVAQEESNRQTHLLMREIDAHRATDIELQAAKLAADRANQAKSRYVTGISHELRTPLNSILGYAEMLEHDPAIPPHRRDAVAVIRRSGDHLLSLVDGLLDIARIESGKLALDVDELRFPEFLSQTVGMFRLQAHNKGINFVYDEQGKVPAVVRADKKRLGQILINIVGNAVKFTETGGVSFRLRWRGDIATFEVRDSGIGIEPTDMQRLFRPFSQIENVPAGRHRGTGLGLYIARRLATMLGGRIEVVSRPGEGSVFTLVVPVTH